MSFAIGRCIFLKYHLWMSLGVQPLMHIAGGCGHDKAMVTLRSWLSFFSLVMKALTLHQGVKGGESNGPSIALSLTSFVM